MQFGSDAWITNLVSQNLNLPEKCLEEISLEDIPKNQLLRRINFVDQHGKTPIFYSISNNYRDMVKYLIENGAQLELPSFVSFRKERLVSCSEPPLVTAARLGSLSVMSDLLAAGCNPDAQMMFHPQQGSRQEADLTSLHIACESGNLQMVEMLMNYKARVDIEDRKREFAIHFAARCNSSGSQCEKRAKIVKLLLASDAFVDPKTKAESTPLYLAAFYKCTDVVKVLLDRRADVNATVPSPVHSLSSPLHISAYHDTIDISQLLIQHKAKLNVKLSDEGYTPIQLNLKSHGKSKVAWLLLYHGAQLNVKDRFMNTLMSYCVKDMRLDCEGFARMLVYAGYNLNQDHWLMPHLNWTSDTEDIPCVPEFQISSPSGSRMNILVAWLRRCLTNPHSLQQLCRVKVRSCLQEAADGCSILSVLDRLPAPVAVKHYIRLGDVIADLADTSPQCDVRWLVS